MKNKFIRNFCISDSAKLIANIEEFKTYLRIKFISTIDSRIFEKRYSKKKDIKIVKFFFVKESYLFLYFIEKKYYLDRIYIKNGKVICQNLLETEMNNCNLFRCQEFLFLTSYDNINISTLYVFSETNKSLIELNKIQGIIYNIFKIQNKIYFNVKNSKASCIFELDLSKNILEDLSISKFSCYINCLNEKYIVFNMSLLKKEIIFVYNIENKQILNLSAKFENDIKHLHLLDENIAIILECGCNDHLIVFNLVSQKITMLDSNGNIYCNMLFIDSMLFYIASTYKGIFFIKFNLILQKKYIIKELYKTRSLKVEVQKIQLRGRTLEVLHYIKSRENKGIIIYLHGGPSFHFRNEYNPLCESLNQAGYEIVCVNYRGSTGYGKYFENLIDGNWGVNELNDVIDISEYYNNYSSKLYLLGESYGAFLCLHALISRNNLWKKCCMVAPFISPVSLYNNKDCSNKNIIKSQLTSPIKFCDKEQLINVKTKLLILHGKYDNIIPISESNKIVDLLIECNKRDNVDFTYIKGNFGHELIYPSECNMYRKILISFFNS